MGQCGEKTVALAAELGVEVSSREARPGCGGECHGPLPARRIEPDAARLERRAGVRVCDLLFAAGPISLQRLDLGGERPGELRVPACSTAT
jgi:hypothetical protein